MTTRQYSIALALVVFSGFLGGVVAQMAFSVPQVSAEKRDEAPIITKSLFLVEGNAKPIAWLREDDGRPSLDFMDKNGKRRMQISVGRDGGPGILFFDKDANIRSLFELSDLGVPSLTFLDRSAKKRATLFTWPNGNPGLRFFDGEEKPRLSFGLPSDTGDEPILILFGNDKVETASISVSSEFGPAFRVSNKNGKSKIIEP